MAKDAAKPFAFVAMCFDSRLQSIYFKVVKPVLEEYGFECWRGDEFLEPGVIVRIFVLSQGILNQFTQ